MTQIPFPYLPSLPEITFRHLYGPEDAPTYVALIEACREIDAIDPLSTLEEIPTVTRSPSLWFRRCRQRTRNATEKPMWQRVRQEFLHYPPQGDALASDAHAMLISSLCAKTWRTPSTSRGQFFNISGMGSIKEERCHISDG